MQFNEGSYPTKVTQPKLSSTFREGECKVTVASDQGKEAVVHATERENFFGEGCLIGRSRRLPTAPAMTDCELVRFEKATMVRVLHNEPKFSELFVSFLLARNARIEGDLVDQLFNSSANV